MMKMSTRVTFTETKKPFIIDGIDVNRIIISKQGPYG